MLGVSKAELDRLYRGKDIQIIWDDASRNDLAVIKHPQLGYISPNRFREIYTNKPCPYCGKKMVRGKQVHATDYKDVAIQRGYEYINSKGQKKINRAGRTYFHPNYITIDHKINKARCPKLMFEYSTLQAVCWRCNSEKSDDNTFDSQHTKKHLNSLVEETVARFKKK